MDAEAVDPSEIGLIITYAIRSDTADEVRLLVGHFFVLREQSQYCDYALETK